MEIPKNIIYRKRRYELVKEYPNFILYKDKETGVREAFHRSDLSLIEDIAPIVKAGFHRKNIW